MISSATISANPNIARDYGIDEAIFLYNMFMWTSPAPNNPNDRMYFSGRYWINVSLKELQFVFRHMSMSGLKRCIDRLIKQDMLVKGNFNTSYLEKTLWYALTDKAITICQNEQDAMFKTENIYNITSYYNCIEDNKLYLIYNSNIKNKYNTRTRETPLSEEVFLKTSFDNDNCKMVRVKRYGKFNNIMLSDKELDNIQKHFPKPGADIPWQYAIDKYSEWLNAHPDQVKQIQGKYYYYITNFDFSKIERVYKNERQAEHNKAHPKRKSDKYTPEQMDSLFTNLDEVEI